MTIEQEPKLSLREKLRSLKTRVTGLIGVAGVLAACTASPEPAQTTEANKPNTTFSEPQYGNPDLPACDYDKDGNPTLLSPGEAFITAAQGAWASPDGNEAYIAPVLTKNLLPGEENESGSLKPHHVNGGPLPGGALPLFPINPSTRKTFQWQGTLPGDNIHRYDTCYDNDVNVQLNSRITTRIYKAPGQAELFRGQWAPYPSTLQNPRRISHADLLHNQETAGLYIVGVAEVASAGIKRHAGWSQPPFKGW